MDNYFTPLWYSSEMKTGIFYGLPEWRAKGRERARYMVRVRDNFTCQDCGRKWKEGKRQFDVHHLNGLCGKKSKEYDSTKKIKGLITLCHQCHFNRPEHKSSFARKDIKGMKRSEYPEQLRCTFDGCYNKRKVKKVNRQGIVYHDFCERHIPKLSEN